MAMVGNALGEVQNVTIVLENPAHFHGPDGSSVHVQPGSYHVGVGSDGHLLLGATQAPEPHRMVLQAFKLWHPFSLNAPLAVTIDGGHDAWNVVLLLPGGAALQATGSLRSSGRAGTPAFVTDRDVAQAIIMRFPLPGVVAKLLYPFNAATVPSVLGTLWGTIQPGSRPTSFVPGSAPPNWVSTTVAACLAAPGASCPGIGQSKPRNPTASEPQLVSTTSVTVTSMLTWAGQTVELLVTAQVVNTGGMARYMTWTDLYRHVPGTNDPFTFNGVIVATGTPPPNPPPPGHISWAEESASDLTSPSHRGAPTEFELRVNGITQAYRSCEYLGHYPGGTPELRCS